MMMRCLNVLSFPSEVFLISGGNILPTGMLKEVLTNLETSNNPEG